MLCSSALAATLQGAQIMWLSPAVLGVWWKRNLRKACLGIMWSSLYFEKKTTKQCEITFQMYLIYTFKILINA